MVGQMRFRPRGQATELLQSVVMKSRWWWLTACLSFGLDVRPPFVRPSDERVYGVQRHAAQASEVAALRVLQINVDISSAMCEANC